MKESDVDDVEKFVKEKINRISEKYGLTQQITKSQEEDTISDFWDALFNPDGVFLKNVRTKYYKSGEEKATETSDSRSFFANLKKIVLGLNCVAGACHPPIIPAFSASEKKSDDELMFFFEKRVKPVIQKLNGVITVELMGNSILFCRNDDVKKEFTIIIGKREFKSKDYVLELKLEDFASQLEEEFRIDC